MTDPYLDAFLDFSPWDSDDDCHYCGAHKGQPHAACLWASARAAMRPAERVVAHVSPIVLTPQDREAGQE